MNPLPAFRRRLSRLTRRRVLAVVALALLVVAMVPVFQANVLRSAPQPFFDGWDRESQALVLGKIEQDRSGSGAASWGLMWSEPDHYAPYSTVDLPETPPKSDYAPYTSQLGLQGYLFEHLYAAGCSSTSCLTTAASGAFSLVLAVFAVLLGLLTRRSLGVAVVAAALVSPWVVAGARNLYWVPWTYLLPACAAAAFVLVRSRRGRVLAGLAVAVTTAVRAACGYEFITFVVLLALAMPVLGAAFRGRSPMRSVLRDVSVVLALSLLGFAAALGLQVLEAGGGDVATGLHVLAQDAAKRTYGTADATMDETTRISLAISPVTVLGMYVFAWKTDVFALHLGSPLSFSIAGNAFWLLVVAGAGCVVLDAAHGRMEWRRNLVLLVVTGLGPVSWFVLAKAHSYTASYVNFILWYLVFLPAVVWVLLDLFARSRAVETLRSAVGSTAGSRGSRPPARTLARSISARHDPRRKASSSLVRHS